jgi:glycosyltransferase involved in cell wall biosynthesis
LEVVVVVDGPDAATVEHLSGIEDIRLKVIVLPDNGGPANARNVGVKHAIGVWVAFLDDDDEWLPQKLERQLEVAERSHLRFPVIACRFIALTAKGNFIWPRRLLAPTEPVGDYLFARNSLFRGETHIATSALLTKRELLELIPFNNEKYNHEDLEWLIRVSHREDVEIEFLDQPLLYVEAEIRRSHPQQERVSLSNVNDWRYSLEWIRSVRDLVSPKAYSGFILTWVSSQASAVRDWKVFWSLLYEAMQLGQPRWIDYLLYLAIWFVPEGLRHWLRSLRHRVAQPREAWRLLADKLPI